MTYDYSRLRGTADRLIARFGQDATLSRTSTGAQPQKPWDGVPAAVPATYPVRAVSQGVNTRYGRDPAGALIPRTVRVVLIGASGVEPQMGDRIEMADGTYEISRVERVQPGDTALLFSCEIAI